MPPNLLNRASLPAQDDDPGARAEDLAAAQDRYVWDWSWPPGCATLRELPRGDTYALDFVARTAALQLEVRANHLAMSVEGVGRVGAPKLPTTPEHLLADLFSAAEEAHRAAPRTRPASVDHYADYFAALATPPIVTRLRADPSLADRLFAWQRVAGANPMSLRRITALPDDLPLSEARYAALRGASLAAALAEGRAFAVDFTLLHGAPATRYLGRQKYLCGARGVFTVEGGALLPAAIQLEPGAAVFTPTDGEAWAMARYCLQVADANVHETMEHLGATHLVMEAVGVAARRQLSARHPLRQLVDAHIVGTFAINESAKRSLIAPGGVIDRVFFARIDVAASLVRASLDRFSLQDRAPAVELAARGVDDRERLPEYPYRDDIVRVYEHIARFVEGYVRAFYADDAAVAGDPELRAWVAEAGSPIGGALRHVRPVETVAALVTWVSNLLHVASAQHAAVNFPQYPFFGWAANTAGACWGPPPRGPDDPAGGLLSLMPGWDCVLLQADTVFQLSSVHYNRLGDYDGLDRRAADAARDFADGLRALDAELRAEDARRWFPYPFLQPSQIPASINI